MCGDRHRHSGVCPRWVRTAMLGGALIAVGVVTSSTATATATRSPRRGPAGRRFYIPPRTLPSGPHGSLIWERPYHGPAALDGTNTLLLYSQVGVHGELVATSGYMTVPKGTPPEGGWPVVTWAHGTTGIADQCAPTRYPNSQDTIKNDPLLNHWLKDGYAVVRTDYGGSGHRGFTPIWLAAPRDVPCWTSSPPPVSSIPISATG